MKNIERIRKMNAKELITFFKNGKCNRCSYNGKDCGSEMCSTGMEEWLNQEGELTIKDIEKESRAFCKGNACEMCRYIDDNCSYMFMIDHFNIIDGKITRRQK